MNNIDRMHQEVKRFSAEADGGSGGDGDAPPPDVLVEMLMRIVDLEDRHLLKKSASINKDVEAIVRNVAEGMAGGA